MKKFFKYTFFLLLTLFVLIVSTAYFIANKYEKEITNSVISELNKQLETEVEVENISFSLLQDFPKASLEFKNILIHSTKDFLKVHPKMDTLIWAKKLSLDFNLIDIYNENYRLSQVQIKDGIVKMQMDKKGRDNFHFTKENTDTTSTKFSIDLKKVILNKVSYRFNNWGMGHHIQLFAKQFSLNGNLSDDEFGLSTSGSLLMQKITVAKIPYLMYPNTSLNLDLMVNNSKVEVKSGNLKLGDEYLDIQGAYWFDQQSYLDLTASSKHITIKNLIRNLPANIQKSFDDYNITGDMTFNLKVKGEIAKNKSPNIEITALVDNASLINKTNNIPLKNLTLKAHYLSKNSSLDITNFNGFLRESFAKGSFSIHNFLHPRIAANLEIESDLKEIKQFFQLDSLYNFKGKVNANLKITGQLASNNIIRKEDISTFRSSGDIEISNAEAKFVDDRKRDFHHLNANLRLDNNNIIIDSLDVLFGHSNARITGKAYNTLAYILLDNETLNINGSLSCDSLDMADILSPKKENHKKAFIYPKNLATRLSINIKKFTYDNFHAKDVFAKFYLNKSITEISDFRMNTSEGQASGQMNIYPNKDHTFNIELNSNLSNIDIDQLMYQLNDFGQKSISYKNLDGKLTAITQLTAHLDTTLNFDLSSLKLISQFNITEGEIKNYKPLFSLSKFIELSDLKDIKFDNFQNTIQIKDSKLFIPKMQIQSNAIDLFMSGEHSFTNQYSYRINLLLSEVLGNKARKNNQHNQEFGFIQDDDKGKTSLFLLIEGNGDNMHIKYDTKSVKEHLKEGFKEEKTNLKTILNEEFGLFKKDSAVIINKKKPKEKSTKNNFQIEWEDK